ncbi:unnamed protein product [Urochloa decumbens]|uniref:Purple acid phosphatase n=1 Tax=Urochloa decumbens TaxID=240449 RepID=A0ABC9ANV5_9POAL
MMSPTMSPPIPADEEYIRPPPRPLVLMPHDKPASHPQQVHISSVGADAMEVTWVTDDRSAPSVVDYGTSPGNFTESETGYCTTYQYRSYTSGAIHRVTIGPLQPGTTYYYRCGGGTAGSDELTLRTPPVTLPIELVIIGDVGQTEWTASTLSQIGAAGMDHDMLLLPGDLSYADRDQPLWDSWGRLVQPLASARPWMVVPGNHERETLREPPGYDAPRRYIAYDARWRAPGTAGGSHYYYSFDAAGGAAHVVMLDSYAESGEGSSEQQEWLRRDLAAVDRRRTPWLVVLMHVPWYNTNYAKQGEGEGMRRDMERLLYEARVDVVFASHVHTYERFTRIYDREANSQGPMYITIGDAGNSRSDKFVRDHELAHLSVCREASFGHGRLRIVDERRAVWTWHHRNDDQHATVSDEVWLESLLASQK